MRSKEPYSIFHLLITFPPMVPMVYPFKIILSFLISVPSSFKPISLFLDSVTVLLRLGG